MEFWKWLLTPEQPVLVAKPTKVLDISEPVIELLSLLNEDLWEPVKIDSDNYTAGYRLNHTMKKLSVIVYMWFNRDCAIGYSVYGCDWMTSDESKAVGKAVEKKYNRLTKQIEIAENKKQRELYKQHLEEA